MTANGLSEKKNSILEINDLCFAYPEEKKRALNHVSLHVEDCLLYTSPSPRDA